MQKFATYEILGHSLAQGHSPALMRTAHRAEFHYTPRHGFLYVRSRMISSRCNDNFDEFPAEEIEKGYMTFIGKPVFVNHANHDHTRNRGVIIDVALHKDANRDGSPDTWVEGLMEIDALTYPKLAAAIIAEDVDRTSMGVDVAFSICAACGNKATTPLEYCRHIPAMKGMKLARRTADGTSRPELVRERCYGLAFFENSLLVEQPADPTAYFLDKPVLGPGLEHLAMTRPSQYTVGHGLETRTVSASASPRVSMSLPPMARQANLHATAPAPRALHVAAGGVCPACRGTNTIAVHGSGECFDCEHTYDALMHEARLQEDQPLEPLVPHKRVDDMEPHEKTAWNSALKTHSAEWHKRNPMSAQNIVDHWHAATPDEKENGKNWYGDAHHGTRMLAEHTGTPMHVAAGLVSNYSPQTHWATNITTAAKVMRTKQAVGGPGNRDGANGKGILASNSQKAKAHEMITNHTHYNDLLAGPKTRAFAHLIEHGGDSHEDLAAGKSRVVVDRHALSVAAGARASDAAYGHSGLSGKKKYSEAEGHYQEAARQISQHEGETIHPHQVQAATWLVRQRLNEEHDRTLVGNGSRSAGAAQTAIHHMQSYMGEHHPSLSLQMPGTGYSKRGDSGPTPLEKTTLEDHATSPGAGARKAGSTPGSRRGRQ